jgi:hypothetical protein
LILLGWSLPLFAEEGITLRASLLVYDDEQERLEASGRVTLSFRDFFLSTEHVLFVIPTLEVFVDAPFEARLGGYTVRGESLYYSFEKSEGWVESATMAYLLRGKGELLFRGKRLSYAQGTWQGEEILCTGCKREPPFVSLRAREVTVFPEGKVTLQGLSLYIRDKKIVELPFVTRTLQRGGSSLLPELGFSRGKGWYTGVRYEYPLSSSVFFLGRYTVTSRKGSELKMDLEAEGGSLKGRIFWDVYSGEEDTWGGLLSVNREDFSLLFLDTHNERVDDHLLSRSPQIVASLGEEVSPRVFLSGKLSYGYFIAEDYADTRWDARVKLSFNGEGFGAEAFLWGTSMERGGDALRIGGKVFWEKELSPYFWTRLEWRFVEGQDSPFFFDLSSESLGSLEFRLGDEEGSFLRLRGRYDFLREDWSDLTVGIGVGSKTMSLGMEGIYSFPQKIWGEKRYFLRRRIEDCVDFEVSLFEPEGDFFVALNFLGFDEPRRAESLFEEEEPFDPLSFERETKTP